MLYKKKLEKIAIYQNCETNREIIFSTFLSQFNENLKNTF